MVCDPAPIPADEMQRTYDWLKSWGMLRRDRLADCELVNMKAERGASAAPAGLDLDPSVARIGR